MTIDIPFAIHPFYSFANQISAIIIILSSLTSPMQQSVSTVCMSVCIFICHIFEKHLPSSCITLYNATSPYKQQSGCNDAPTNTEPIEQLYDASMLHYITEHATTILQREHNVNKTKSSFLNYSHLN